MRQATVQIIKFIAGTYSQYSWEAAFWLRGMRKTLRSLRSVIQLGLIPSQSVTAAAKIFIEAVKRGKIGQHTPQRLYSTGGWKVSQRGIEEDQNKHRLRKKNPGDTSETWNAGVWSGTWCVSRRLPHILGGKKNLHFTGPKEACSLKLDEEKRWKACLWVPLPRFLFIVLLIWALVSHQDKSRWANLPMNNLAQHSLCVCSAATTENHLQFPVYAIEWLLLIKMKRRFMSL